MVKKNKIYCYVDESGQDIKSQIFVVVVVLVLKDRNDLQKEVIKIEEITKIFKRKWHKSRNQNKYLFLREMIERKIAQGEIYFGRFKKPTPYFLPIIEVIEKAIISKHFKQYRATVCVDGIDKKKSEELTKALRSKNIQLNFVKSCRDESEPLIRVADRWAGCIRGASLKQTDDLKMFQKAQRTNYIVDLNKQ